MARSKKSSYEWRGKRPFRYEPSRTREDNYALRPQDIVDAVRFLVGWIHFAPKHHKRYAMPLYAGLIDVARYVLGVELYGGKRWRLPDKYTIRLREAGFDCSGPKNEPWKIKDWGRFNLALYQIVTEGRFDVRKHRKWLKMGAEAPSFEFLYPKGPKDKVETAKKKELSDKFLETHFNSEINSHLFDK
jgi:hypothetical protein